MDSILLSGGDLVTPDGVVQKDILIQENVVSRVGNISAESSQKIDASGLLIFPGFIDCHVHFREPGFPDKATMATETASARAGGVTTVCEMPNTNPPTVTVAALADKIRRASEIIDCDTRFFFGVTEAIHLSVLRELFDSPSEELERLRASCCGVKLYLDHSTGDQKVDGGIIDEVFEVCAELKIPLVAHCEDAEINAAAFLKNTSTDMAAHSLNRPPESEEKAIVFALEKAKKYGTHLHVAHLSTHQGLEGIREAKKEGITVTCEVAPHHLFLSTNDYKTLGTFGKMNPPLRSKDHCEALFQGLVDRTVDCVSTDHAPHTIQEKQNGPALKAPSGVPGVETMIPLLLTAASGRSPHPQGGTLTGLTPEIILDACFTKPNQIFSLGKFGIHEGKPVDLIIVDPQKEWRIEAKKLHSKCGWSPFEDWSMIGAITQVITLQQ